MLTSDTLTTTVELILFGVLFILPLIITKLPAKTEDY